MRVLNFFTKKRSGDAVPDLVSGQATLQILIFGTVGTILIAGFALWADTNIKAAYRSLNKTTAFAAAEAGLEYYRWHLAHAPTDFWDGRGATSTGPYVHDYYDKNGSRLGTFSLEITPPPIGSTIALVKSTGRVLADSTIQKVLRAKFAKTSFAKYAIVSDAASMRFGAGTETFGPIHSNGGIRFDGLAHNIITSAVYSYDDPDHTGAVEFGVHTHVNAPPATGINDTFRSLEAPPAALPARTDIFQAGRRLAVAPADFDGITQDLSQMMADAKIGGFFVTSTGSRGYEITLRTNGTFTLRRVTTTSTIPSGCPSDPWTVSASTLMGTYPLPANGLLFVEGNAWIKGQVNGARLTIASGIFPDNATTRTSITFASSTLYTNYDGTDVLSYIAQNNVNIAFRSENIIRIDGAIIAQNGRVGRYYYDSDCGTAYLRSQLTSFGMIGTNQRYGFAWVNGSGVHVSGYNIRDLIFDANLLYAPPPSFPLTTDDYAQISWEELQ